MDKLTKTVLDTCETYDGDWVSVTEAIKKFGEVDGDPYDFWRRFKRKLPTVEQLTQMKGGKVCLKPKDIISVLVKTEGEFATKATKALKKAEEEAKEEPKKKRGTKRKAPADASDDEWEPPMSRSSSPEQEGKSEQPKEPRQRPPTRSTKPNKRVRFELPPVAAKPKRKGRGKKKLRLHERRPPKPEEPMKYFYCNPAGEIILETPELKQQREAREAKEEADRAAMPPPPSSLRSLPRRTEEKKKKSEEVKQHVGAGVAMDEEPDGVNRVYQFPVTDQPLLLLKGEAQMVTVLAISNPWLPEGATPDERDRFNSHIDGARAIFRDIALRNRAAAVLSDSSSMSLI